MASRSLQTVPISKKIERLGLDYLPLRPQMDHKESATWFEYGLQSHVKEYRYLLRDLLFPHLAWNFHQLESVAPDHNLLLNSPLAFPLPIVAEKLGKPWVSLMHVPMGYPVEYTRHRIIGRTSSRGFSVAAALASSVRAGCAVLWGKDSAGMDRAALQGTPAITAPPRPERPASCTPGPAFPRI